MERFKHLRATGEHDFKLLRPGLTAGVALADEIATGLSALLKAWPNYGTKLEPLLVEKANETIRRYAAIRQKEGGPGTVNAETWLRV